MSGSGNVFLTGYFGGTLDLGAAGRGTSDPYQGNDAFVDSTSVFSRVAPAKTSTGPNSPNERAHAMANPVNPLQQDSDSSKREHRPRVLKGGAVITGIQNSEVAVTLRNQHASGAELKMSRFSALRWAWREKLYDPVTTVLSETSTLLCI